MNCKQGDLAYITREPYLGHFVTVLRWSPEGNDTLPDGFPAQNRNGGGWICEKACGTFHVTVIDRGLAGKRYTPYAVIADRHLRPIRDADGEDEILRIAGLPKELERA